MQTISNKAPVDNFPEFTAPIPVRRRPLSAEPDRNGRIPPLSQQIAYDDLRNKTRGTETTWAHHLHTQKVKVEETSPTEIAGETSGAGDYTKTLYQVWGNTSYSLEDVAAIIQHPLGEFVLPDGRQFIQEATTGTIVLASSVDDINNSLAKIRPHGETSIVLAANLSPIGKQKIFGRESIASSDLLGGERSPWKDTGKQSSPLKGTEVSKPSSSFFMEEVEVNPVSTRLLSPQMQRRLETRDMLQKEHMRQTQQLEKMEHMRQARLAMQPKPPFATKEERATMLHTFHLREISTPADAETILRKQQEFLQSFSRDVYDTVNKKALGAGAYVWDVFAYRPQIAQQGYIGHLLGRVKQAADKVDEKLTQRQNEALREKEVKYEKEGGLPDDVKEQYASGFKMFLEEGRKHALTVTKDRKFCELMGEIHKKMKEHGLNHDEAKRAFRGGTVLLGINRDEFHLAMEEAYRENRISKKTLSILENFCPNASS